MTGVLHVCVAMKPLEGNFAQNALAHGVAGLDIDGCRVGFVGEADRKESCDKQTRKPIGGFSSKPDTLYGTSAGVGYREVPGRWPANVIHDGSDEVMAGFAKAGVSKSSGGRVANISKTSQIYGGGKGLGQDINPDDVRGNPGFGDTGTSSRFFKQVDEFREEEL